MEGAGDPGFLGNDHVDRGYPALAARPQALSGGWGVSSCLVRLGQAPGKPRYCQTVRDPPVGEAGPRAPQDLHAQRASLGFLAGACR